jgi:hypothetical protein
MEKEELKEKLLKMNKGKEICIICGKETEYNFDTPIQERKYYIEGVGQLCKRCYYLIYYGEKIKD